MNDQDIRPTALDDLIGQEQLKRSLRTALRAAGQRSEPLDHVLLYGSPGTGKTTLAGIVAREMGAECLVTSGPAMASMEQTEFIGSLLGDRTMVFIDEIHRLPKRVQESLYPAMEDFRLEFLLGYGYQAVLNIPKFTLIGATTRFNMLTPPMRERFGLTYRLEPYTFEEIMAIAKRSATILGLEYTDEGIEEVARRARSIPRICNIFIRRMRDYGDKITQELALECFEDLGIDKIGLNPLDRRILTLLEEKGEAIGLHTIAHAIQEDADTVMDVHEPYLLQLGLIERTQRGRKITDKGAVLAGDA